MSNFLKTYKPKSKAGVFDIDKRQLRMLAEYGHTDKFMATFYHVGLTTWKRWKKENEEFFQCLSDWKKNANAVVERALYEKAVGKTFEEVTFEATGKYEVIKDMDTEDITIEPGYRKKVVTKQALPDAGACMSWLTNRDKENWSNKVSHDVSGDLSFAARLLQARKRAKGEDILE